MPTGLISKLLKASAQKGRSAYAVAFEMMKRRVSGAGLGFSEYFDFRQTAGDKAPARGGQP